MAIRARLAIVDHALARLAILPGMGAIRASLLLVLACGCGRIGFDSLSAAGDVDAGLGDVDANMGEVDSGLAEIDAAIVEQDANLLPAAASFSDAFSDENINSEWEVSTTVGCTVGLATGSIRFFFDGTAASRCVLTTGSFYDLNGSSVAVAIPPINAFSPELTMFLSVANADGDRVQFAFNNGNFTLSVFQSGVPTNSDSTAYDNTMEYWRIREAGQHLFLESSTDFVNWTTVFQLPAPFAIGAVKVAIGAETSGPMPEPISVGASGYNSTL